MPDEVAAENVQTEAQTFPDDPMAAILEEDAVAQDQELETALRELTGDDGEPDLSNGNVGETTTTSSETTDEGTSEETGTGTSPRRAPIDEMLSADNLTNEQRETLRSQQATITRLQTDAAGIDRRVEDAVSKAVEEAMEETEDVGLSPDDALSQVTPQQMVLFERLADKLGFVKATTLDERDTKSARDTYLSTARDTALGRFGDGFGARDTEGNVVLAEGVEAAMSKRYAPIQKHGTLTLEDLYVLTYHDELIKAAEERGTATGKEAAQGRRVERTKAQTESRTSGVATAPDIRGKRGTKSDNSDSVFARAALIAQHKLRSALPNG